MTRKLVLFLGSVALLAVGYATYLRSKGALVPGLAAEPIVSAIEAPIATGDSLKMAEFAARRCKLSMGQARQQCYEEILLTLVEKNQVRLAMDALSVLARLDPGTVAKGHDLTHVVGINAWTRGKDVDQVYQSCTGLYQSGCYHGVVQAYLDANGIDSTTVARLCNLISAAVTNMWLRFQCVHGVGHGLVNAMALHLPNALAGCDWLVDGWDSASCYGGAFMEFIVASRGQAHHPHTRKADSAAAQHGEHAHHEVADTFPKRKADDLLYPCTAIKARYQSACYGMQAGIIFETTGDDWGRIARACDGAPPGMRAACYQGIGTYLSGFVVRNPRKAITACDAGSAENKAWCFVGVVKNFIDVTATADDGLDFCARVLEQPAVATACYVAIGEQMAVLYPVREDRARECARAGAGPWEAACRYGAGLNTERPAALDQPRT